MLIQDVHTQMKMSPKISVIIYLYAFVPLWNTNI